MSDSKQFVRSETAQAMLTFGFPNNELFESLFNHTKDAIHKELPGVKSRTIIGEVLKTVKEALPEKVKHSSTAIRNHLTDIGQSSRIELMKTAIQKVAKTRKN